MSQNDIATQTNILMIPKLLEVATDRSHVRKARRPQLWQPNKCNSIYAEFCLLKDVFCLCAFILTGVYS